MVKLGTCNIYMSRLSTTPSKNSDIAIQIHSISNRQPLSPMAPTMASPQQNLAEQPDKPTNLQTASHNGSPGGYHAEGRLIGSMTVRESAEQSSPEKRTLFKFKIPKDENDSKRDSVLRTDGGFPSYPRAPTSLAERVRYDVGTGIVRSVMRDQRKCQAG